MSTTPLQDAAGWHSAIAERFDSRYRHSPAFRERLAVWTKLIERYADPNGDTLDAGCGSGVLSAVAATHSRRVVAFDASAEMVRLARQKQSGAQAPANVTFRELRMERMNALGEKRFKLVMSSSVLEYLDDFWGSIDALAERLAPQGTLLFSVPNMSSLYRQAERVAFAIARRPRYMAFVKSQPCAKDIAHGLAARGFTVLETRHMSPAPVLSKLARPLGLERRADTLAVYACRR